MPCPMKDLALNTEIAILNKQIEDRTAAQQLAKKPLSFPWLKPGALVVSYGAQICIGVVQALLASKHGVLTLCSTGARSSQAC